MSKKSLLLYAEEEILIAAVRENFKTVAAKEFDLYHDNTAELMAMAQGAELVLCPGGCLKPMAAGVYAINDAALEDASDTAFGIGIYDAVMKAADEVAKALQIPAYFTDAMSVDELLPLNRVRSNNAVPKYSRGYRAEHMAALKKALGDVRLENGNYIVAYIDNLVSVGAYSRGSCLEMNDCIGGEGPMGFTSAGDVPCAQLATYFVKSGKSFEEMCQVLTKESGMVQYLGIRTPSQLDELCHNDTKAREVADSMVYQICKSIGMATCVLKGDVQQLVLTGKGASSRYLTERLQKKLDKLFPVTVVVDPDMDEYLGAKADLIGTFAVPVKCY